MKKLKRKLKKWYRELRDYIDELRGKNPPPPPVPAPAPGPEILPEPKPEPTPGGINSFDFRAGFLWKPVSDTQKKLVVLLPEKATGHTTKRVILWHKGQELEVGVWGGVGNGNREHYRYRHPGADYPAGIEVRAVIHGHTLAWRIAAPGRRHDGAIVPEVLA